MYGVVGVGFGVVLTLQVVVAVAGVQPADLRAPCQMPYAVLLRAIVLYYFILHKLG